MLRSAARQAQDALEIAFRKNRRYLLLPDRLTMPPDWQPDFNSDLAPTERVMSNAIALTKTASKQGADYVLLVKVPSPERLNHGRTVRVRLDVLFYEVLSFEVMEAFCLVGEAPLTGRMTSDAAISEAFARSIKKVAARIETMRPVRARIRELVRDGVEGFWATMDCGDCRKAGFTKGTDAIVILGTDGINRVRILRVEGERLYLIAPHGRRVRAGCELLACLPGMSRLPEI